MKKIALAAASLSLLFAAAPSAHASDASVKKAVVAQEKKAVTAAKAFTADSGDATSAIGRERAQNVLEDFQAVMKKARTAVVKEKATGSTAKKRRTAYIKAVDRTITGLKTFGSGLAAFDPDSPAKAAALVKKAKTQLASAAKARASAARAF